MSCLSVCFIYTSLQYSPLPVLETPEGNLYSSFVLSDHGQTVDFAQEREEPQSSNDAFPLGLGKNCDGLMLSAPVLQFQHSFL